MSEKSAVEALTKLTVGVLSTTEGAHVIIHQPVEGGVAVIYMGRHPIGETMGIANVSLSEARPGNDKPAASAAPASIVDNVPGIHAPPDRVPPPPPDSVVCEIPPVGWYCTRAPGHDGPCAAYPVDPSMELRIVQLANEHLTTSDYDWQGDIGQIMAFAVAVATVTAPVIRPAGQESAPPALNVWYGSMPESNGKSNYTAMLVRKDAEGLDRFDGFTIARSEYPDRVRYEADCVRHIIGELAEKPWITEYDADKHSGYTPPQPLPSPAGSEKDDEIKRKARNQLTIDGHLNDALDAVMRSNSPDGKFCILGAFADLAIDAALAAQQEGGA